jgi:protein-L-isoaspartate(D-aspartate) O-methyltransferase
MTDTEAGVDNPRSQELRREMVEEQIRARGIRSERVLAAMMAVPRHVFVAEEPLEMAYADRPLGIGQGQTISQPFMVAAMAEALELEGPEKALDVGTGSGYSAAVLSRLCREVFSIETHASLAERARATLARLGYHNIHLRTGDGSGGWPEAAPFDAIEVAAAAPRVPQPLLEQLAAGGRLIIPVGGADRQDLVLISKRDGGLLSRTLHGCMFVPLTGEHGFVG